MSATLIVRCTTCDAYLAVELATPDDAAQALETPADFQWYDAPDAANPADTDLSSWITVVDTGDRYCSQRCALEGSAS